MLSERIAANNLLLRLVALSTESFPSFCDLTDRVLVFVSEMREVRPCGTELPSNLVELGAIPGDFIDGRVTRSSCVDRVGRRTCCEFARRSELGLCLIERGQLAPLFLVRGAGHALLECTQFPSGRRGEVLYSVEFLARVDTETLEFGPCVRE